MDSDSFHSDINEADKWFCGAAIETTDKQLFREWLDFHKECLEAHYRMKGMVKSNDRPTPPDPRVIH